MQMVMFTKMLQGMTIPEMAAAVKGLGLDGFDLALREGFPVTPANVREAFPEAVKVCADNGLTIGMVTAEGNWTSADASGMETSLAVMVENGCRLIKPGYWQFKEGDDYWTCVERARKDIEGLARLAEKHGVTWLVHTHSDLCLGNTCGALLQLIGDFDPNHVAAFIDPGHLSVDGEPLPMAVSMVKDRLRAVAVKNLGYVPTCQHKGPKWRRAVVPLDEGLVDWGKAMKLLGEVGFEGPMTIHSEYDLSPAEIVTVTAIDLAYLRGVM